MAPVIILTGAFPYLRDLIYYVKCVIILGSMLNCILHKEGDFVLKKRMARIAKVSAVVLLAILVLSCVLLACGILVLPVKKAETGVKHIDENTVSATVQYRNISGNSWYNAKLAATSIDGLVLKPGEEFSWLDPNRVGPCGKDDGYKAGIGITKHGPILDYGGGICVTSTVLYQCENAVGLKTTERHSHSKSVSYATQGEDSAINAGSLDLKFVNDTEKVATFSIEIDDSLRTMTCTCMLS